MTLRQAQGTSLRADVVSIFPDYLAPLRLSLIGKAIDTGLVELGVHDLRTWTHDRHRTVDDTPYGGGAGMVMKPEPWGAALDAIVPPQAEAAAGTRLVVPTPSGRRFTQAVATELAAEQHLVFACDRYEGIDARVMADATNRMRVDEISIGDYVLNGGEAAVLVILEAVVRLLPGVVGNPGSLTEESHAAEHDGLLEGPVYTKPTSWRGLDVPPVLLSGHHGAIDAWRRRQALERTRRVRPDLAPGALEGVDDVVVSAAKPADAGELLTLQRAAFMAEGRLNGSMSIPPLTQTLDELAASLRTPGTVLVARAGSRIVATVRGSLREDGTWWVSRLMVAPDQQRRGLGTALLRRILEAAPPGAPAGLLTGAASRRNLDLYRRFGFRVVEQGVDDVGVPVVTLRREALS